MNNMKFFIYLSAMAGVTYLVRMIPFVLVKSRIKNRYVLSFLHYIPYSVLAVMTIPAIFSSTSGLISALVGTVVAVFLAFRGKSLLTVAASACAAVFVAEWIIRLI